MDMDVLCNLLYQPPMLYLVVMIGWSIALVPHMARYRRHRLVWLSALLHLVVYIALLHRSVGEVPWSEILLAAIRLTFLLTLGGYLLHWITGHAATEFAISCRELALNQQHSDRSG